MTDDTDGDGTPPTVETPTTLPPLTPVTGQQAVDYEQRVAALIGHLTAAPASDSPERVLRARARDIARAAVYAVAINEGGNSGLILGQLFDLHPGQDPGGAAPGIAADCLAFIAAHYHLPMVTEVTPGMTPDMVRAAGVLKRLLATYAPTPDEGARLEVFEQLRHDDDLALSVLLHLANYTALVVPQMDTELAQIIADPARPADEVANAERLVARLAAFREASEMAYYDWLDRRDTSLERADI